MVSDFIINRRYFVVGAEDAVIRVAAIRQLAAEHRP